ncbi:pyridoxamine 5'-phosphate oxidase family protein [Streptomyces poriticola]|uniref:pyridoxamine 5'-phosphate oxidase family protein n=1 Tax=Streptomyces poriticola TaxID=3120506 RepID=UPI002FCDE88E
MTTTRPQARLDPRYSDPESVAPPWPGAEARLAAAELFWISTVRPDGRPHVTSPPAVRSEAALHLCTGPQEGRARNLDENPQVVLTTGTSTWNRGYDLVVEGAAVRVTDDARLREPAAARETKYGSFWHFEVRDGCLQRGAGHASVYAVAPRTVFGFGKGEPFSPTRWRL